MEYSKKILGFPSRDERGNKMTVFHCYTVYTEDNKVIDIRNEVNHSVERKSEVWERITGKNK